MICLHPRGIATQAINQNQGLPMKALSFEQAYNIKTNTPRSLLQQTPDSCKSVGSKVLPPRLLKPRDCAGREPSNKQNICVRVH